MPFSIPFATMLEFSTRGTNEVAQRSRQIAGNIKSSNPLVIDRLIFHIKQLEHDHPISKMLNDKPILVPAPRSSPTVEGGMWPTRILCKSLVENGLGGDVREYISRDRKVPKSSLISSSTQRPSCNTHYESISVTAPEAFISKIVLVDDVFTLGRTSCACVRRLKEAYPEADISVFAAMRTRGFVPELNRIVKPSYNKMVYVERYDKVELPD